MTVSRRDALKSLATLGAGGVVAAKTAFADKPATDNGGSKTAKDVPLIIEDPKAHYPNTTTTEDKYRAEFAATYGDKADHGTAFHCVNCQGNCAWQVWVKDGVVTRENQSANYPSISPDIPDFNPRGCNKGVQHSQSMYDADRVKYPMKRVGERGGGKWKRISWDEAIDEVAGELYNTMLTVGPAGNYIHNGAGIISEARGAAMKRLGTLLGAVRPYIASYVGDMFPGTSLVYGEGNIGCSFDFMFGTDVQVYWGCNPNSTRIPDAHFLWEGKYNGSKVIVISPEFNSTAIHADRWIPIKPGYDGHLAMSLMHEMVEKKMFDERLVCHFTDLPMLVRKDNNKLLRLSDIDVTDAGFDGKLEALFKSRSQRKKPEPVVDSGHGGHGSAHGKKADTHGKKSKKSKKPGSGAKAEAAHAHDPDAEVFLTFNKKTGKVTAMPGCEGSHVSTLRLRDLGWDIDPVLEGSWKVKLKGGETVEVTTVFGELKEELKKFSPEATHKLTGVHPVMVRELAKDIALPKVVSVTIGFSLGKHFNGMLTQRAISSLMALTCRMGERGGMNTENEWSISGLSGLSSFDGEYKHRFASGFVSEHMLGDAMADYDKAFTEDEIQAATGESKKSYMSKLAAMLEKSKNDEGVGHGKTYWDTVETFFIIADARFRRNKGGYRDAFLKKAKFLAVADFRMGETSKWADILLPATSHYEVWDLRTNPGYHRFANTAQPPANLKPVGEARNEWAIASAIAKRVQELALANFKKTKKMSVLHIPDPTHTKGGVRPLDLLEELYSKKGVLGTDKKAVEYALAHVDQFRGETIESTFKRGGFLTLNDRAGKTSPLYKDQPYSTFENNYYLNERFETLTGRLTFYVDHPLWISSGAAAPTATLPLRSRRHPFLLMTPHARWSIHSTYKTSAILLRLGRGKPWVMVNPKTAEKYGVKDGEDLMMFNDLAEVKAMVKVTPTVPKDAIFMEHGWEPFMYETTEGHNALHGDMLNLLEVSDGWGHLKFGVNWDGNQHAYTGAVQLKKA
ncbi:MAG: molybdopterin-dependent oxidoreductase [Myxococcales bacterium]|nr:molybdopterin-dependent oxidoreductase [Myxococcales bacterium]